MILDAWFEGSNLVVLSADHDRLEIPFDDLERFLGSVGGLAQEFEIDDDGRFLEWPHADCHLGWLQLKQLIDPQARLASLKRSQAFQNQYGAAIRALRESQGIRQSQIVGLNERQVRRIEQGQQFPTVSALRHLAQAHRLSLSQYLDKLAQRVQPTAR